MSARVIRVARRSAGLGGDHQGGRLQRVEGVPGVAVGPVDQVGQGVVVKGQAPAAEAPLGVGQGPGDDQLEVAGAQRLQPEQQRAAHQGRVHGEERVLGGRPDQHHRAVLDPGQQGVLLALVEAVDLVDEQDAPAPQGAEPLAGRGQQRPHVLDPGAGRRQLLEMGPGGLGDDVGQGGLPRPGRPPQDHRPQLVGLDQRPQRALGPEHVPLPDELLKGPWPHPRGQRRVLVGEPLGPLREQVHSPAIVAARATWPERVAAALHECRDRSTFAPALEGTGGVRPSRFRYPR